MGNCLMFKGHFGATNVKIDKLYEDLNASAISARTFGTYNYPLIAVLNGIGNGGGTYTNGDPASTVVLCKNTRAMSGPAWGTYWGYRWYYYDSNGAFRCDAASQSNANPAVVYGIYGSSPKVTKIYNNPSVADPGASNLGKFPQYSFIIVSSRTAIDKPGTTIILKKGDKWMGGTSWGGWYGKRWYYFDSDGTVRWDASTHGNVTPYTIYGVQ